MAEWEDNVIIDALPLETINVSNGDVIKAKCPNCSDYKERLFFLWSNEKNYTTVMCHRGSCSLEPTSLKRFVKEFYPDVYSEYYGRHTSRSHLAQKSLGDVVKKTVKKKRYNLFRSRQQPHNCISINHLHKNHKAVKYVESRKIPKSHWHSLYYCRSFKDLAKHYGHDTSKWVDEDRLVIPFWDKNRDLTFIQGRSFKEKTTLRYITLKINSSALKIWGLDTVNPKKKIYVTEGPIDAMFLPNSVAMAGADIPDKKLMEELGVEDPSQVIFVYDNEPDSEGICKKMYGKIRFGFSIVLWNGRIVKQKDVNDMILKGFDVNKIEGMTFEGIRARVRFKRWKKC